MAKHNDTGKIGEDIAERFLKSLDFEIIERNFWRPYGEIDIVSRERNGKYRFIEVKTVSWETGKPISHGTVRPEENMHPKKIKRMMKVIESYILAKGIDEDWQFDVLAVYLDQSNKKAKIRHLENVILGS
jgi:putative endonuclease